MTEDREINIARIHVPITHVLGLIAMVVIHSFSVWFLFQHSIDQAVDRYDAQHTATPHTGVDERMDAIERNQLEIQLGIRAIKAHMGIQDQ